MLFNVLCFFFYILSSVIIVVGMFRPQGPNKLASIVSVVIAIGIHSVLLSETVFVESAQNMSMLNVASLVGWLISVTMLLASFKLPNTILLPVVYSFTGLVVLLSNIFQGEHLMYVNVQPTLLIHVTLALFAYACLAIASLYAIQLSYINLRLKEKKASLLHSSLPPLLAVENILFKLLVVGNLLLTLSLVSGFIFLEDMFAKEQAHKTLLSLLAWLLYTFVLIGQKTRGWRGKRVIAPTIIGGVLLTLAYFGSRFVREVILSA